MFNSTWYQTLLKPLLTPPSFVFPVAWGILYALIFISLLFFIFSKTKNSKRNGFIYFTIQILLNFLWPFMFFGLNNMIFALFTLIFLDLFLIFTVKEFYKVSKISSLLLMPYLIWVFFATYLNIGFLVLNN